MEFTLGACQEFIGGLVGGTRRRPYLMRVRSPQSVYLHARLPRDHAKLSGDAWLHASARQPAYSPFCPNGIISHSSGVVPVSSLGYVAKLTVNEYVPAVGREIVPAWSTYCPLRWSTATSIWARSATIRSLGAR